MLLPGPRHLAEAVAGNLMLTAAQRDSRRIALLFTPMYVDSLGELTEYDRYWRLVYDGCGHIQDVASLGLEEPALAAGYIRRNFPRCLECQLLTDQARRMSTP
jgi:hypothetical protein